MKTLEQMQAAVDAIRAVCKEHGVLLTGACKDEGIDGEIRIEDASEYTHPNPAAQITNRVENPWGHEGLYEVLGIGDPSGDM